MSLLEGQPVLPDGDNWLGGLSGVGRSPSCRSRGSRTCSWWGSSRSEFRPTVENKTNVDQSRIWP